MPARGAMLTKVTRDAFLLFRLSKKASELTGTDDCDEPHVWRKSNFSKHFGQYSDT
jgi:hypothetical protein